MKKLLVIICFWGISFQNSQAQTWLDLTFRGGWGPDFLVNGNIINDEDYNHQFSHSPFFGGRFGVNFGDIHAISADVMSGKFKQSFKSKNTNNTYEYEYKKLDLALLYKKLDLGRYVEIGPVYTIIKDTPYFNEQNWGVILGFGRSLVGSNAISLNLGIRFQYMLTDVLNDEGIEKDYPYAEGIYPTYKSYHPLSAKLLLELDWALGAFVYSKCYKRKVFKSF